MGVAKTKSQQNSRARKTSSSPVAGSVRGQKLQPIFAEGLCFQKLFFVFLIGSVFGTIYEDILIYVRSGVWMVHRGVIYGPFNVIYGFGAAVMCWLLLRKKYSDAQIFIGSALMGGLIEYLLSFLQEVFTGTVSWDYSGQWLSLGGRTTVPIMIVWGAMGLVLVKVVYPALSGWIERIPVKIGQPLFRVLLVLMCLNCLVSWTAIIRQNLRHHDIAPLTPIGRLYDEYYTDEYLRRYFPNMVRQEGTE